MSAPPGSVELQCSKCGASLTVDGSTQTVVCRYCNASTFLPQELWSRLHPPPAPVLLVARPSGGVNALVWLSIGIAVVIAGVVLVVILAVSRAATFTTPTTEPRKPQEPIATVGEPCNGRRAACSKDKLAELSCSDGDKMVVTGTCKGPNGCRVESGGDSISCDTTYAAPKDPCAITDDACSIDHKAELRCQSGHFVVIATCKGPDGCTLTPAAKGSGYTLSCDDHVADAGEPCFDSTRTACSSDKKALLTCTAQRFTVDRKCPKGCVVKKLVGTNGTEMHCE